jgi:hypothetical protein
MIKVEIPNSSRLKELKKMPFWGSEKKGRRRKRKCCNFKFLCGLSLYKVFAKIEGLLSRLPDMDSALEELFCFYQIEPMLKFYFYDIPKA